MANLNNVIAVDIAVTEEESGLPYVSCAVVGNIQKSASVVGFHSRKKEVYQLSYIVCLEAVEDLVFHDPHCTLYVVSCVIASCHEVAPEAEGPCLPGLKHTC